MQIIDVRTKGEYDTGHIDGAINHDIILMLRGSFPDLTKDEEIWLYCESGNRSMMAKTFMERAGFTNVKDKGSLGDIQQELNS